jgi:endonuclease/exonuclease/phosphatase (EEP) superfamily protein YafD
VGSAQSSNAGRKLSADFGSLLPKCYSGSAPVVVVTKINFLKAKEGYTTMAFLLPFSFFMPRSISHLFSRLITNLIAYLFILLTVVVTLLSLLGYLGKSNIYLEVTSNFKLQYFLIGLFPFIYFALTRRKIWWILSLFCLLINLTEIVPWYIPKLEVLSPSSGQPMRLFLSNVLFSNTQYADVISLVRREKPTFAAFLEATDPWPEKLEVLRDILPYHLGAKQLEIEVYSSLPLENSSIQLYGEKRGMLISNLKLEGKDVTIIATHTYPQLVFGKQGSEWRNQHLEEGIGDYVAKIKKPVVVIGDLNVVMWSPYYRSMIQRSGLRNARAGFGVLPTLSSFSPTIPWLSIPVDHCLVSPDIQVVNTRTGSDVGSDHLPLITDVLIPVVSR